jgi:acyl dehydratase
MIAPLSFEDLAVGRTFGTGTVTVEAEMIKAFASEFDPQPFHLDEEAARGSFFGGLVASGWHTAGTTMRLLVSGGLPIAGGIVGTGGELLWTAPVRPGDTLHVECEVLEIMPSRSKPDRGTVVVRCFTKNQRGEMVQSFTPTLVVPRRVANKTTDEHR